MGKSSIIDEWLNVKTATKSLRKNKSIINRDFVQASADQKNYQCHPDRIEQALYRGTKV